MGVYQLRELRKDLHHLVGTLAASRHDDNVGSSLLGDSVLEHGLTCSEGAGDEARTTLDDGIERIDSTDTCLQQLVRTEFLGIGRQSQLDGPALHHIDLHIVTLLIGEHGYRVANGVVAFVGYFLDGADTLLTEGSHHLEGLEILLHLAEPVACTHLVAHLDDRLEVPQRSSSSGWVYSPR